MKKVVRNFLCAAVFSCVLLATILALAGVVDKVIVVVNDEVITQREFDRAFLPVKQGYETNFKGEELKMRLEEAEKQLLEQMINTKLIISLAKEEKIEVDEAQLNTKLERIKSYYVSEDEFLHALSAKGTNLTEFEREMREQMLGQGLVDKEVASKIVITPADTRDLYEKNKHQLKHPTRAKVRGIMVRKTDETGKSARGKIKGIASDLKKGRKFEKLALEKSEGPYAGEGGDMGYVAPGQMLPKIDEVIFSMKKGEVSDIVETDIGYHLFKIEDIEEGRTAEFAEVSDFLREQLFRKRFEENLVEWISEKRKNAYISYK
ncbi:MAG: peptidylprolyl isomerase [Candidatus Omnitrophota bacterium]